MSEFRGRSALVFGVLALACAVSVWPVVQSGSIPAFQQDWAWPLSRSLSLQWLHGFIGLWDDRALGQANALPWQTYAVATQTASILIFGPSVGLAIWIAGTVFLGAWRCGAMLERFGVARLSARMIGAALFAFGPVPFTRIAAGHLAYLLAYALLPWAIELAHETISGRHVRSCIALGFVVGLSACQIQFYAIDGLAIALLIPFVSRSAGWFGRLAAAGALSIAVQLQALLPMLGSATPSLYLGQRAILSWEYNNSSPFGAALVGLGYFTHYYESHALAFAAIALYVVLGVGLVFGIVAARQPSLYAVALVAVGTLGTAGLYGPASGILSWLFTHTAYATVFRDLHYFAALVAIGTSLLAGFALQRFRALVPLFAVLALWIAIPELSGNAIGDLVVPKPYVNDTLADMRAIASAGRGRVIWLPAEEPVGLRDRKNWGRDFAAYGPAGNPSASDDLQNPQMAYALATLRAGHPDWNAFTSMGVRYLVYRNYVRSVAPEDNLGTGFRIAYWTLDDGGVGRLLAHDNHVAIIRRSERSNVYELPLDSSIVRAATADPNAMLFSELKPGTFAIADRTVPLDIQPSTSTADPRAGWVAGRIGWRYRSWMPDSIYPFVWTVSAQPLSFALPPKTACVLAGADPAATLRAGSRLKRLRGSWKRRPLSATSQPITVTPQSGVAGVATVACPRKERKRSVLIVAGGYDAGWRKLEKSRFIAPQLANGWMMAWDSRLARAPLIYLPALLQALGFAVAVLAFAGALALSASSEARSGH